MSVVTNSNKLLLIMIIMIITSDVKRRNISTERHSLG